MDEIGNKGEEKKNERCYSFAFVINMEDQQQGRQVQTDKNICASRMSFPDGVNP
jgi:hypothetical protein